LLLGAAATVGLFPAPASKLGAAALDRGVIPRLAGNRPMKWDG
jgi:hypothetical protein